MASNIPTYGLRLPPALKAAAERAAATDGRSLNNWLIRLIEREVATMTKTTTQTYSDLMERLQAQGYEIVSTGGITERIEQHIDALEGDPAVTYGDSERADYPSILVYAGGSQPLAEVWRRLDYLRWCNSQDFDVAAEVSRLALDSEYRAAYVGHCRLTGPEHQHLDDAVLLAVAVAEAERQGLIGFDPHQITAEQICIGMWGGR